MRWLIASLVALAGCSKPAAPTGKVVVALTIDWEGAYFSGDALDALDRVRATLDGVPLTHFVSAAYFTKPQPDDQARQHLASAIRDGDEVALHLHAWKSLALRGGIEPRLSPSFLTGTDELVAFPDGDVGFDVDLDVYGVADLRTLVRTSRELLEQAHLSLSSAFRAGGYLATPKVLQAIREEGLTIDSSATHAALFGAPKDKVLRERMSEVWPTITPTSQPFSIATPAGAVLEMPISVIADYSSAADIAAAVENAVASLRAQPSRDVFVVIAFHQETADEFGPSLATTLQTLRAQPELGKRIELATLSAAAGRASRMSSHR